MQQCKGKITPNYSYSGMGRHGFAYVKIPGEYGFC
jgi:hypothetical protein